MPFWDRNDAKVPDEIRDVSQDDMVAAVKFFKENKAKMAEQETALQAERAAKEAAAAQLEEMKKALAAKEQQEADRASAAQAAQRQANSQQAGPVDFWSDPDTAYNQRQAGRDMIMLGTQAQVARMSFEGELMADPGRFGDDPAIYKKYRSELVEMMKKEPLINQGNPQAWKNAFYLIKGYHSDDINEARSKQDGTFFGEKPKPAVSADARQSSDEITDDDRKSASRYGITPEAVRDARKSIRVMPVEHSV